MAPKPDALRNSTQRHQRRRINPARECAAVDVDANRRVLRRLAGESVEVDPALAWVLEQADGRAGAENRVEDSEGDEQAPERGEIEDPVAKAMGHRRTLSARTDFA
ncbi:MAG: hypothetical protein AMXMBFR36_26680 [Acidobacteriota bacterium]